MSAGALLDSIAYLKKRADGGQSSLYEHLVQLLLHITQNGGEEINVSDVSELLKRVEQQRQRSHAKGPTRQRAILHGHDRNKHHQALELFGDRTPTICMDTGVPYPTRAPSTCSIEDLQLASFLFDQLGAGIGEHELYEAYLAAQRLGQDPEVNATSVRFFGKVFGTKADYYVFEALPASPGTDTPETDAEKQARLAEREYPREVGSGTNHHAYYVCNALGAAQPTRLPDVEPRHIRLARPLKRFFTGHLDAAVSAHPPFPFPEAVYLRAQIARLACSTVLAPAGWFEESEDDDGNKSVVRTDGVEPLSLRDKTDEELTQMWVHRYPHLKKIGRCEAVPMAGKPDPEAEEEAEEGEEEVLEEPPAGGQVLAAVNEDQAIEGRPAWIPTWRTSNKHVQTQPVGLQSTLWPGAFAVAYGTSHFNIYVGWACKGQVHVPAPPPPIMDEFDLSLLQSTDLPPKPDPDLVPPEAPEGEDAEE